MDKKKRDADSFGDIRSIKAAVVHDMEPYFRYGVMINGKPTHPKPDERWVDFPVVTEVKVTYDDWIQTWEAFDVKTKHVKECVDQWHKIPIITNEPYVWSKEIQGYTFRISSYEYKTTVSKEEEY